MITTDSLIIGAGLCGLTLSRKLNRPSIILEKSQGLGGRIANRRIQNLGFDHGASFLKKDSIVCDLIDELALNDDLIENHQGLYLKNSMTRLPKKMAENLNIKKSTKAEKIIKSKDLWSIITDQGEEYLAKNLILTAPLPQSLELLSKSNINFSEELKLIKYSKGLMALVILKENSIPDREFSEKIHSVLPMKERDLHPQGFVIRASENFSEIFFEQKEEEVLKEIVDEFKKGFSLNVNIDYQELKKWRYVSPLSSLPYPYIELDRGLYLTGDSFLYPDVRGSILGATLLAEKLKLSAGN